MIELILMLNLSAMATSTNMAMNSFQPCERPYPCKESTQLVQFQPCVWPNKCKEPAQIAQFQPCVWPNKCKQELPTV